MSRPIKVMFFCLGNICRSPLAEALFIFHARERGLEDRFHIESSGTSSYHVGESPDPGSQRVAKERLGVDISHQRSQQLSRDHVEAFDALVAMDRSNQRTAMKWSDDIMLLRDFEPLEHERGSDVPDPWGGGGRQFEAVYDIVYRCTERLLDHLEDTYDLH